MRARLMHVAVPRVVTALVLAWALLQQAAHATGCTLIASAIAFGTYDPIAATPNDSTGTVHVSCTPGLGDPLTTPYTLTIAGTGAGNDTVRSIASGSRRLYFQVYKNASRSQVWGNGTTSGTGVASSVTSAAVAMPAVNSHTAYSRLPAGQWVAPGAYLGALLVTIEY